MKRLLAILILSVCCSVPVKAFDCPDESNGWETGTNNVQFIERRTGSGGCPCWDKVLGSFSYSNGEWEQDYYEGYSSWTCNWGIIGCGCDGSTVNPDILDANEYLAYVLIESGYISDYLNDEWSGGNDDPDFEGFFLDLVEQKDADTTPVNPPYENPIGSTEKADPVFMSNSEYTYSTTDLSIQGRSLKVEIVRTYGSQRDYNTRFGYGWDINCNMKVRRVATASGDPNVITLLDGGGYRREYTQDSIDPNLYERDNDLSDYFYYNDIYDTFKLIKKSGIKYEFDPNGNLSLISDENGNYISFTYDNNGLLPVYGYSGYFDLLSNDSKYGLVAKEYKLETITDDLGRQISFTYDSNGLLTDINDFKGRNWQYTYDPNNNNLISVEDPNGHLVSYGYGPYNNLVSITDPNGQKYITNYYDANDRVYQQDYGNGTFIFDYNSAASTSILTDREGYVTKMVYTNSGQIDYETIYTADANDDPNSFTTEYFYNANNELTTVILPDGNSTIAYTYNDLANVTGIYRKIGPSEPNDANSIAILYTYDPNWPDKIKTVQDPMGEITSFDYDAYGNVKKITSPSIITNLGEETPIVEFTYNSYGQVETVTAPDAMVTKYQYYTDENDANNYGHLWKVIVDYNSLNLTTEYEYDRVSNVIEITDPNGNIIQFTYNEIDLLTQKIDALNNITHFSYNPNKKLSKIEREKPGDNQITDYTYDILDHLETVIDPLEYVTTFGYNKNEDPNLVIDAEENSTVSEFNERGLLWRVTDANDNITEYSYDENGNLETIEDANGGVTTYDYDGFGRLELITYPDDTNEIFTYDKNSNILSKTPRAGEEYTIYYEYNALNMLVDVNRPGEPNIVYTYDIAGRVYNVDDRGYVTKFRYDQIGRLEDVNDPEYRLVSYVYDQMSRREKLIYPDNSYVNYEYDALGRLIKVKDSDGNSIAEYEYDELSRRTLLTLGNDANAVYEYDLNNRLTDLTNNVNDVNITFAYDNYDNVGNRLSMQLNDANAHAYTYDEIYRLTFVDYNDTNTTSYTYDALGNRKNVNDGSSVNYTIDSSGLNQYTDVGGTSYSYDNNGNLTDDGTYEYYYDCENRLTDVNENGSPVASYTYDFAGRRIEKIVDGNTIEYCYDGDQVIAEYDGSDNLLRKFIYGPGIDEPICMINISGETETIYYYHFDGLGSVVALSNVNNQVVETYSYDVFGEPNCVSDVNNPYYFTGRRLDIETDNYYYRARYYKPEIGRFLQPDPLGYDDGLNMYTYVGNNLINFVDPYGLCKGTRSFGRKLWEGDYVGTQYGDEALDYYAKKYLEADTWYEKAGYYTGGLFSSLWTPKSWKTTALTLGPSAAGAITKVTRLTTIVPRASLGADGASAVYIRTTSRFSGRTIKLVQVVTKEGKVIHKHVKVAKKFLWW